MKLNKKAMLTLGTLASIVAPIAATVSCGSTSATGGGFDGRYDTKVNDKVVIHSTWSSNGAQFRTFDKLVDKYNETQKDEAGFLPVELQHVEGGYGDAAASALTKFESGDKSTLPNLIVDYPAAAAQIKAYEMELNFSATENGFVKSGVDATQLAQMNNVGGVKDGETIAVPLAISTEMIFIDKPLMKHFFEVLKTQGATVTPGTGIVKQVEDTVIGSADKTAIEKLWGAVPTATGTDLSSFVINDDTFKSYESLIELGDKVMHLTNKNATDPSNVHFMGSDSPGNLEFVLTESLKDDAAYGPMVTRDATEDHYVVNNWYKGGTAKAGMNKANTLLAHGLSTGSLWLGGGGEYGSNLFVEHKMALTVGSTAGYIHQYDKNKSGNVYSLTVDKKKLTLQGPSTAGSDDQIGSFTNGTHNNFIKSDTHTMDAHDDKYHLKTKTAADTTKINTATTNGDFIIHSTDAETVAGAEVLTLVDVAGKDVKVTIIPKGNTAITSVDSGSRVNFTDMAVADNVALKALKTSTNATILPQGPGLVGVHSNATGDKATTMFVNWLYKGTQIDWGKTGHPESKTVADYFAKHAYYIVPKANYLSDNHAGMPASIMNALSSLQAATTDGNNINFTEVPVDETSSPLRGYIEATLKAARDKAHTTGSTYTADEIYNKIQQKATASRLFK